MSVDRKGSDFVALPWISLIHTDLGASDEEGRNGHSSAYLSDWAGHMQWKQGVTEGHWGIENAGRNAPELHTCTGWRLEEGLKNLPMWQKLRSYGNRLAADAEFHPMTTCIASESTNCVVPARIERQYQ